MNGQIVIVDDMAIAVELMKTILNRAGYQNIITYECPLRALHDIEQGLNPLLVISDFRMPTLNGVQFLEAVLTINPSVASVIITGDPGSIGELPPNCQVLEKGRTDFFKSLIKIVKMVNEGCHTDNFRSHTLQQLENSNAFQKIHT